MTRKEFFPVAIVIRTGKPILPGSSAYQHSSMRMQDFWFTLLQSQQHGSTRRLREIRKSPEWFLKFNDLMGQQTLREKSYFCLSPQQRAFTAFHMRQH